jgi:hypothetical protein
MDDFETHFGWFKTGNLHIIWENVSKLSLRGVGIENAIHSVVS